MASCSRTDVVSILNNDDNPSFAVRPAVMPPRHHSTPLFPYQSHPPQMSAPDYRYGAYPDSPAVSPRGLRHPYDPISSSEAAQQPLSPGSSDGSHDYTSYHPYSRRDSYHYPLPGISSPDKRMSVTSPAEPPSPQASLSGVKDLAAPRGNRKNKYPCPYAASHGCSATFTTSGHAARHGKKHTGEKSVHCPICNKAFTRKDNMKQHIRTHRTHSEDGPMGMGKDGEARTWMKQGTQMYTHGRSMSQSQSDRNAFHGVTGMNPTTQSSSHGRLPF